MSSFTVFGFTASLGHIEVLKIRVLGYEIYLFILDLKWSQAKLSGSGVDVSLRIFPAEGQQFFITCHAQCKLTDSIILLHLFFMF